MSANTLPFKVEGMTWHALAPDPQEEEFFVCYHRGMH